ncbi:MAG: flavodoxin, partial [Eubacteriaceae bacterium]|nr:flavodoxin [Eubacteriaceae bacterium]
MKKLVAYFSAEGTTAGLAKALAEKLGADLFEIVPEVPYTAADIKWTNPLARCNREKAGKKDVPVAGKVEGFGEYDTVYLGFPIWYYAAPNVINTFCSDYSWEGKKLVLFATSGGSG